MKTMRLLSTPVICLAVLCFYASWGHGEPPAAQSAYDVTAFGAKGDGSVADTEAVQKAMDAASQKGGGTVYFAPGTYSCGSLHLRSGVTLYLDAGATIQGIRDATAYDPYEELGFKNDADRETSFFHHSLLWGEDVERVGIIGEGTVDSNWEKRGGPKAIALKRCRYVHIAGIHILNAPNYAISLLGADYVNIDGVTIRNAFSDGIDPDASQNVRIANCHIESWDDAIVPKASFSLGERRASENITVTNCYLSTACNAFKLGTESGGDFKRIAVSNCVMAGLKGRRPATGGISLETVDGANLEGVVVSNITMVDVRAPIFIRLGNRGRDMETPVPGSLKNVTISNVVATRASLACSVSGIPGHHVEGVTLSNICINYIGGQPYRPVEEAIPEMIERYPDPGMFDAVPLYGLFCRHVSGLVLSNVRVSFDRAYWRIVRDDTKKPEWSPEGIPNPSEPGRPGFALLCDDVANLTIEGFQARPAPEGDALLRFVNVRDALVRGCMPLQGTKVFVETAGPESSGISLIGNDLTRAQNAVALNPDVPAQAVAMAGNVGG